MTNEIPLGTYLFTRLKQLQVSSIFGVPGDFNLELLDHVYKVDGLRWVGNTNELNAGYSADGYARVNKLAALVTTFGVGELSALAAVAGSYAEHIAVVHIVGVPSLSAQGQHLMLHHTLGNGDYNVFRRMSEAITEDTVIIQKPEDAPQIIDKALRTAYIAQRPVYVAVPSNLANKLVSAEGLDTPIDMTLEPNEPDAEQEVLNTIASLIKAAERPIILVDACAGRHGVIAEVTELSAKTQFPVFVTPMGKGAFDEHNPLFGGVYVGSVSRPEVAAVVEAADLVLSVGGLMSDFNTGSFTYHYSTKNLVEFHSSYIKIRNAVYDGVRMKFVLQKLVQTLKRATKASAAKVSKLDTRVPDVPDSTKLKHEWLWKRVGSWLQPGDIIITETGTASFGIVGTTFPKNVLGISQVLWGSIGYSVGACLGAAVAADDESKAKAQPRRVLLFVGDGSLQLTVTEISTMVRWGLKPYLFILNNNGYTIERLIHGEKAPYNDVHPWKYSKLLDMFNAENYEADVVRTNGDVNRLFESEAFSKPSKIRSIEVMLETMDAPEALVKQANLSASANES